MRCPDCRKFVSYGEQDPETNLEVDADGHITGEIRIVLPCGDCGTELKEATFQVEVDAEVESPEDLPGDHAHSFTLEEDLTSTSDLQHTDRHGRPIRYRRYMRTLYGASATFSIRCECGAEGEATWEDSINANSMEELV